MKVRIYTEKEIDILENNMFVRKVKYKREIEYDPLFKIWCVMMRLKFPELTAREIFYRGGFDINILHHRLPQRRIKDWVDNYKKFGIKYFFPEDEFYQSIRYIDGNKKEKYDSFKLQLFKIVIKELKELNINDDR